MEAHEDGLAVILQEFGGRHHCCLGHRFNVNGDMYQNRAVMIPVISKMPAGVVKLSDGDVTLRYHCKPASLPFQPQKITRCASSSGICLSSESGIWLRVMPVVVDRSCDATMPPACKDAETVP